MSERTSSNPVGPCGQGPGIESSIRSDSSKYNAGTMQNQLIHEEVNTAYNHHIIVKAFKDGRAKDIADVPKVEDTPCIIVGSGPSLDDSIPFLKDWKGGIFCTTSHALSLLKYGIAPTHIVALDPFCQYSEIEGVDWSRYNTKLVAQPGVWPTLIENWPNEMIMYLQNIGRPDSFYATTQKRMFSDRVIGEDGNMRTPTFNFLIRTEITLFACSPPLQLFVADLLGYGPTFLCGIDFAYHADKERFTDYTVNVEKTNDPQNFSLGAPNIIWDEHVHPYDPTAMKEVVTDNGLKSHEVHLYYKKNFISAWRLSNQTIYTTDHGAVTEIPYADIKKVIRTQGQGFHKQSKKFIADIAEKYLAKVGAFVVETANGVSFVEAVNPEDNLLGYMAALYRQYHCPTCNASLQSNDLLEHKGDECPTCHNKTLTHAHKIDIEYNIRKFIKLLNKAGYETDRFKWKYPFNASPNLKVVSK